MLPLTVSRAAQPLMSLLAAAAIALAALVAVGLVTVPPAAAQGAREIPDTALKGKLTPLQVPNVSIDGKTMRLAPGAQIFSATRSTITPNQIKADTPVRYVLDGQGQVRRVWIVDESVGTRRTGPQQ